MGSFAIHSGWGKMWWFWWDVSLKKTKTSTEGEPLVKYPVTGNDICNQDWWCQQKPTSAILVHWCSKQLEYFQGSWIHSQSAAQWCQHPTACSVWLQTQRLVIGDILGNKSSKRYPMFAWRVVWVQNCLHEQLDAWPMISCRDWHGSACP